MPDESSVADKDAQPKRSGRCPRCNTPGKALNENTVSRLLRVSISEVRAMGYLFCVTPGCKIAYFSADGTYFVKAQELA